MYLVEYPEPILLPELRDGNETIMHVGLNLGIVQDALRIRVPRPYKLRGERAACRNQNLARTVVWVINACPNLHFVHLYEIIEWIIQQSQFLLTVLSGIMK